MSFMQFSMVSFSRMLVKRLSISKLDMIQLASKLTISSANEKELLTLYSWTVRSDKIGTKNFTTLYVGVPIADNIGPKGGTVVYDRFMYLSTALKYFWP